MIRGTKFPIIKNTATVVIKTQNQIVIKKIQKDPVEVYQILVSADLNLKRTNPEIIKNESAQIHPKHIIVLKIDIKLVKTQ